MQFYRDVVNRSDSDWTSLLREATLDGTRINFPHSLCLQAIIFTSDNKVLITRRSPKLSYYPGRLSVSLEEQLTLADINNGQKTPLLKWTRRLLEEEIGLSNDHYDDENIRALSLFIEGDLLNCSFVVMVTLDADSIDLDKIIREAHRSDIEFTDWEFMDIRDIALEILKGKREYHPTSGYRVLMAHMRQYGREKTIELLRKTRSAIVGNTAG